MTDSIALQALVEQWRARTRGKSMGWLEVPQWIIEVDRCADELAACLRAEEGRAPAFDAQRISAMIDRLTATNITSRGVRRYNMLSGDELDELVVILRAMLATEVPR